MHPPSTYTILSSAIKKQKTKDFVMMAVKEYC